MHKYKFIAVLLSIILLVTGCNNDKYLEFKDNYLEVYDKAVGMLNQNDIYASTKGIQEKELLKEMQELLKDIETDVPMSKKSDYQEQQKKYQSINDIVTHGLNWDNLSKAQKTELQLKITIEKSLGDD